jgi:hypothetical protein
MGTSWALISLQMGFSSFSIFITFVSDKTGPHAHIFYFYQFFRTAPYELFGYSRRKKEKEEEDEG